jgi:hypothetical protein
MSDVLPLALDIGLPMEVVMCMESLDDGLILQVRKLMMIDDITEQPIL